MPLNVKFTKDISKEFYPNLTDSAVFKFSCLNGKEESSFVIIIFWNKMTLYFCILGIRSEAALMDCKFSIETNSLC